MYCQCYAKRPKFWACMTQWRWILVGDEPRLAGLDYAGCRAAVAGAGLAWRQVFASLQVMEAEALQAEREREERRWPAPAWPGGRSSPACR